MVHRTSRLDHEASHLDLGTFQIAGRDFLRGLVQGVGREPLRGFLQARTLQALIEAG